MNTRYRNSALYSLIGLTVLMAGCSSQPAADGAGAPQSFAAAAASSGTQVNTAPEASASPGTGSTQTTSTGSSTTTDVSTVGSANSSTNVVENQNKAGAGATATERNPVTPTSTGKSTQQGAQSSSSASSPVSVTNGAATEHKQEPNPNASLEHQSGIKSAALAQDKQASNVTKPVDAVETTKSKEIVQPTAAASNNTKPSNGNRSQTTDKTDSAILSQTNSKASSSNSVKVNNNSNSNSNSSSNSKANVKSSSTSKENINSSGISSSKNNSNSTSTGKANTNNSTTGSTSSKANSSAAASKSKPAYSSTLQWSEFFDNEKQNTPSDKFWDLSGQQVTIKGYMGEVLSFDKHWFLLIPAPGAECPFDNGDETYWNKIMMVFVPSDTKLRYTSGALELTGTLDVGIKIDESGYKTMFRLYDASFKEIKE